MKLRMERIDVSVNENGMVVIEQLDMKNPDYNGYVELQPDQIDVFCDWLKIARDQALALRAGQPTPAPAPDPTPDLDLARLRPKRAFEV